MAHRFEIQLPLVARWTSDSAVGETVTESKDMSSPGIYFFLPPKDSMHGSSIEIVMTLPHELTLAGQVEVRCLGRIQRTELQPGREVGMAAAIEELAFLRSDETITLWSDLVPLPCILRRIYFFLASFSSVSSSRVSCAA